MKTGVLHRGRRVTKLVAPLVTCTKEEQYSLFVFFNNEGTKPIKIHQIMKVQYGDACLSLQQVYT